MWRIKKEEKGWCSLVQAVLQRSWLASHMGSKSFSNQKLIILGLAFLAVLSPLYIDQKPSVEPDEDDDESINLVSWLPLLLVVLIIGIFFTRNLDQSFSRLDPYWIHRMGGSSCGITVLLVVLGLVLKCKGSWTVRKGETNSCTRLFATWKVAFSQLLSLL